MAVDIVAILLKEEREFHVRIPLPPSHARHAQSLAAKNGGGENLGAGLPSAAVAVVSASHRDFSGDVLLVDAGGTGTATSGAVLLRATAAGQDVFEIKVRNRQRQG